MSFNLEKGGRFNLSKEAPGLTKVRLGLGWDANGFDTGGQFDLDVSVFGVNPQNKLFDPDHFIFYNHPATANKSIQHMGDNRSGDVAGDDETVKVDLALLAAGLTELSVIVTIHEAAARKQNFGQVKKSYIKLYDDVTGKELAHYNLEDDFSTETAVQFGSLYLKDGQWAFKAVGAGFKKGLQDFVDLYTK
ncbi:TerD family protein [Nostoc sp. CHAB 5834]|nr:TerD family protein [Nostoc sp. CHAB 5834]